MPSAEIITLINRSQEEKEFDEALEKIKKSNNREEQLNIFSELYNKYPINLHALKQLTIWKSVYQRKI